jgi:RNA polymerase sigma-70 factor (ECF subfamily)
VLQQTATVLWSKFDEFEAGTNFAGWALKVAYWESRTLAKRKRRDTLVFSETFIDAIAREHEQRAKELEQVQTALAYCLERLRPPDREMYHLRYVVGQTLAQMAVHAGRPLDTVHSALKRVRRLLNECVTRRLAAEARS